MILSRIDLNVLRDSISEPTLLRLSVPVRFFKSKNTSHGKNAHAQMNSRILIFLFFVLVWKKKTLYVNPGWNQIFKIIISKC